MGCCWGGGCFSRHFHPPGVVIPPATTIFPPKQSWVEKKWAPPPLQNPQLGLCGCCERDELCGHWLWVAGAMARGATEMLGQAGTPAGTPAALWGQALSWLTRQRAG